MPDDNSQIMDCLPNKSAWDDQHARLINSINAPKT